MRAPSSRQQRDYRDPLCSGRGGLTPSVLFHYSSLNRFSMETPTLPVYNVFVRRTILGFRTPTGLSPLIGRGDYAFRLILRRRRYTLPRPVNFSPTFCRTGDENCAVVRRPDIYAERNNIRVAFPLFLILPRGKYFRS